MGIRVGRRTNSDGTVSGPAAVDGRARWFQPPLLTLIVIGESVAAVAAAVLAAMVYAEGELIQPWQATETR
jgi:hypothetical protein